MSYDIELVDPVSQKTLHAEFIHQVRGGTFQAGGSSELSFNITYNYSNHFCRIFGKEGIRSLYGKTGAESLVLLKTGMRQLGDDTSDDYWESTEGNAKQALAGLVALAQIRPDGVWRGD